MINSKCILNNFLICVFYKFCVSYRVFFSIVSFSNKFNLALNNNLVFRLSIELLKGVNFIMSTKYEIRGFKIVENYSKKKLNDLLESKE